MQVSTTLRNLLLKVVHILLTRIILSDYDTRRKTFVIMEKETAIKVLKELHDKSLFAERTALETLIPELAESEDEKVRKKFINLVKKSHEQGGYALHKWEADEMLAWLEKQILVTCNTVDSSEDEKIRKILVEAVTQVLQDQYCSNRGVSKEKVVAWLEKQCNPTDDDMKEALRTEYEKGRSDVIALTISWLANCWPQYCNDPTIIDGFKEALKE